MSQVGAMVDSMLKTLQKEFPKSDYNELRMAAGCLLSSVHTAMVNQAADKEAAAELCFDSFARLGASLHDIIKANNLPIHIEMGERKEPEAN